MRACIVFAAAALATSAAAATDLPTDAVSLGALDKVSARVTTVRGRVGETLAFGNLQIVVRTCLTRPPEERPENSAFLEITQTQGKDRPTPVFSGWMFSSNPAVSAMEHPVYDVWVLACEGKTASKSP